MRNSNKSFNQKKKKSDIAVTLDAYHCHLKKVEDKEHFKLRQEFSRSLAKLNSLDTRDIVRINNFLTTSGDERDSEHYFEEQDTENGQIGAFHAKQE